MQYTFKKNRGVDQKGFTLVETLVAITILLLVIIGPMTIASNGMRNSYYAGDQTTAVYLAQEAIEHIQKLRDDVALDEFDDYRTNGSNGNGNTQSWYTNLDADCKDSQGCDINFLMNTFRDCGVTGECQLRVDLGNPNSLSMLVYGYGNGGGWTDSIFTRQILVGAMTNGGVPVTVTVSWTAAAFGNTTRSVVLQSYFYDHYNRYE